MRVSPEELLAPERLAAPRRGASRCARAMSPERRGGARRATRSPSPPRTRAGNAVSLIQSLYFTWGSALVAGDTGVVLQNRGSFFSLDPTSANALVPGKLHDAHAHALDVPRGWAGALRLRDDGRARASRRRRPPCSRGGFTEGSVRRPPSRRRAGSTAARGAHRPARSTSRAATRRRSRATWPDRGHDVKVGEEWDDLFGHAQCVWLDAETAG